jgi:hypothetical protein
VALTVAEPIARLLRDVLMAASPRSSAVGFVAGSIWLATA